jgi:hypothetical protein
MEKRLSGACRTCGQDLDECELCGTLICYDCEPDHDCEGDGHDGPGFED